MKRFWLFLLAITVALVAALSCAPVALAEGDAHYLVGDSAVTFYYANRFGERFSFTLPSGYTVALGATVTDGSTAYVEATFAGLEGLVLASDKQKMTLSSTSVALPRAVVTSKMGWIFKMMPDGTLNPEAYTDGMTLTYLGSFDYNGTLYYAVQKTTDGNRVYYVLASDANQEDVEAIVHPKKATEPTPTDPSGTSNTISNPTSTENKKGFTWVRLVLIIGIIAPLVVILLFIIRPRHKVSRAVRELSDVDDDDLDLDE